MLALAYSLGVASFAKAQSRWIRWAQEEKFWRVGILNTIFGTSRADPHILGEYPSQSDCAQDARGRSADTKGGGDLVVSRFLWKSRAQLPGDNLIGSRALFRSRVSLEQAGLTTGMA